MDSTENIMFINSTDPTQQDNNHIHNDTVDDADTTIKDVYLFPTSFGQRRLWFLHQLNPDDAHYNSCVARRLFGKLNQDALAQSFRGLIHRHEILRTTFLQIDEEPMQVVTPTDVLGSSDTHWQFHDLRNASKDEQEQIIRERIKTEQQQPFDLAIGPLIRCHLLQLEADEHVFIIARHHIITDAWSTSIFFRELWSLYGAFKEGRPSPLADLPIQYGDFAVWQQEWLFDSQIKNQLTYWREQLADAPILLELPTDRPRPAIQQFKGGRQAFRLTPQLSAALKQLAAKSGATLFMTLLAAFNLLLARLSGQEDILVGTPIVGRNRVETENLIGFFLNTLVLRTDLSGNPSFDELLARVKQTTLDAYSHQDIPFEKLIQELQPERDLSRTPLFQVWFNMLPKRQPSHLLGLTIESMATGDEAPAKFDLTLYVREDDERIRFNVVYDANLFTQVRIESMLIQYKQLLTNITHRSTESIAAMVPFATPQTIRPNNSFAYVPESAISQSIAASFEAQVVHHLTRIAIQTEHHQWSYQELNSRANQIAHALCQQNASEGRIALLFEHDAPMIAAMLGVLKAGKSYVPLDPTYPQERLLYMLADAQVEGLVTNCQNLADAQRLTRATVPLLNVDELDETLKTSNLNLAIAPDSLAYILYTSGSTGQPKGVVQNQRNVLHFIRAYTNNLHIAPEDRLTLLSSYSFDAAVMAIYGALLNGATLYPYDLKKKGINELGAWLQAQAITIYHSTPTVYRHFMQSLSPTDKFSTVRLVVMGGEPLYKADVELYKQHFLPHCLLVNGLGPTESTVTLQYFIDHQTELNRASVPVGYPVDNTEILLLDEEGNETGFSGEMVFRSAHLALGYWQKEQATAKVFLTDPTDASKRLYRTGDLGRYLPDGSLAFLGRRDHQVKIRGFRIELGEIEGVLNQHPDVQETVVIAHTTENKARHLVAYVVVCELGAEWSGKESNLATLRDYLREKLPTYMIPSAFVLLDALPLTPNGKLDRKALPTPDMSDLSTATFVAPRTTTEESVAAIWCEVLALSQVGIYDDFFHLGGHSLLATQVVSRLRAAFGVSLPLRTLFATPTLGDLSAEVDVLRQEGQIDYGEPLLPVGRGEPLALSYAQERLWFLDQLAGPNATYNMSMALRLRGQLHIEALYASLQEIVMRHESLRTVFVATDGDPIQVICNTTLQISHIDLSELTDEQQEAEIRRLYQEQAARPFDLTQDLMLRATLIDLGSGHNSEANTPSERQGHYVLLVTMHHIASDGWSRGIFRRELSALYAAYAANQPSPLTPLPIQYADFAIWQRNWLADARMAEQLAYWKQQLADAPALLELPTDRARPAIEQFKGGRQAFTLTAQLSAALKQLAAKSGATLFMTLLAAFKVLLMRYTGQSDIVVGSPIAGRTHVELESLIGFFVNTLVLRSSLSGDISFDELLAQVQAQTLDAFRHQDIPFEKLVSELQPERSLSHTPLFQVMFVLQNAPKNTFNLPDLQMERVRLGSDNGDGAAKFDLTLNINETEKGLRGAFNYNADLFDASTISRMVGHFQVLLQGIVDNPAQPIAHLPLLTKAEYHQIVHQWNDTAVDFGEPQTIHALFSQQVERTPDAVALSLHPWGMIRNATHLC